MSRSWNPFRKDFWVGEDPEGNKPVPMTLRSFADFTQAEIEAVCSRTHIGAFELTGAVQPHPRVTPEEGYRFDTYRSRGRLACADVVGECDA